MKRQAKREEEEARAKGYLSGHATGCNGSWNGRGVPSRRGADVVPRPRIHASSWRHGTAVEHSWTSCNGSNAAAAKTHGQKCTSLPATTGHLALADPTLIGPCPSVCADG